MVILIFRDDSENGNEKIIRVEFCRNPEKKTYEERYFQKFQVSHKIICMNHIPSLCLPHMHLGKAESLGKNNKNRICHETASQRSKLGFIDSDLQRFSEGIDLNDRKIYPKLKNNQKMTEKIPRSGH